MVERSSRIAPNKKSGTVKDRVRFSHSGINPGSFTNKEDCDRAIFFLKKRIDKLNEQISLINNKKKELS